jgi:phenylacetate-CoA ligase
LAVDDLVLLYVARFQAFKNHEVLIRAFADVLRALPRARLVLAGGGPLEGRMRELSRAMGVHERILFLGEVPYAELPDVYAASTIKVISSDYESFCFAALEAMATGLPIVTTDCGWVPRLIGEERSEVRNQKSEIREGGCVLPVGDATALAERIIGLARQDDLCKKMGVWNRQKAVRDHGWASSAEKLLALYKSLL